MTKELVKTLLYARGTLASIQNTPDKRLPMGVLDDISNAIHQIDTTLKRMNAERIATAILEREHGPGAVDDEMIASVGPKLC